MKVNQGFQPQPGQRTHGDAAIDGKASLVICGRCGQVVPAGTAHIVLAPAIGDTDWSPPDGHVMYCPEHCPCHLDVA